MRKSILVAAAVLAVACTSSAFAKQMDAVVKSVDKATDSLVLDNGQKLTLPEGIEAETLKAGDKIQISYTTDASGKITIQKIRPAP